MHESRINRIFSSLEHAGYPRSLQRTLLPDWVTTGVLADDSAAPEIATILAKRLGLRAGLLFGTNPTVETLRRRDTKYKRSIANRSRNLTAATSISVAGAETIAAACRVDFKTLPSNALELREEVLKTVGGNWLGLRNLLMTCWAHGVPVMYLAELGDGIQKMDGIGQVFLPHAHVFFDMIKFTWPLMTLRNPIMDKWNNLFKQFLVYGFSDDINFGSRL